MLHMIHLWLIVGDYTARKRGPNGYQLVNTHTIGIVCTNFTVPVKSHDISYN